MRKLSLGATSHLLAGLLIGILFLQGCVVAPAPGYVVRERVVGVAPYPGYVWFDGYWTYRSYGRYWVPGHWGPPRYGHWH